MHSFTLSSDKNKTIAEFNKKLRYKHYLFIYMFTS